ncbi:MAG: NfeD family protein [Spirochaetaceae bacterium]
MPLWGSIVLIGVGLLAIFAELLIPAFGLIGVAGLGSIVAAVVFAYSEHGDAAGTIMLAVALVTAPLALFLGLKYFPRTFIGKRLILTGSFDAGKGYASSSADAYRGLVGKKGRAHTTLRPAGVAEIDGRKHSVVAAGEFIERGAAVRVVRVEGSRVVVRLSDGDQAGGDDQAGDDGGAGRGGSPSDATSGGGSADAGTSKSNEGV